jgi:quercetin dioxygenase-like cupin family protein
MRHTFVVAADDVEGRRADGDTALEKLVQGPHTGSAVLEQRLTSYAPGRSLPRGEPERDELLYVIAGSGTLELEGEPHDLEPESGAYVRAGETYAIDNAGPGVMRILGVFHPSGDPASRAYEDDSELTPAS